MLLLDIKEIEEKIFEMLAYLSLAGFGVGIDFLLNWENTHYLKVILLSLAVNLFQHKTYFHRWLVVYGPKRSTPP